MSTLQIILSVIIAILCAAELVFDISLFLSWSKAKEKAFIANWTNFIYILLAIVVFLPNSKIILGWLFLLFAVLSVPPLFTCLSPEGVRLPIFIKGGIDPVENYSYEYKQNSLGKDTLYLYNKNGKSGLPYNIGIKKTKTVKMLAEWYGKHDYENPLIK